MTKQEIIRIIKKSEKLISKMERLAGEIEKKPPFVYDPVYDELPEEEELLACCYVLKCRNEKYALALGLWDKEKMN